MQSLIFIYIIATIIFGIIYGVRVTTNSEYFFGSKNHPTIIIVAVILSAFVGGPMLITRSRFAYEMNVTYLIASFGTFFSIILYCYLSPYLFAKYSDKNSAGEIIEASYGRYARIITGICGTISCLMLIASHIRVFSILLEYLFNIEMIYGSIICTIFVSSYSLMGGGRFISVNSIFQFYSLLIGIPLVFGSLIEKFGGIANFFNHSTIKSLELDLFKINPAKFLSLFFTFSIPYFGYSMISIILSGKNNKQASRAFLISSFIFLILLLIFVFLGFIAYTINPEIRSKFSFFYVSEHINSDCKSLIVVSMISIIISSIDLFLNSSSIAFIHDIVKVVFRARISEDKELKLLKLSSLFIMISALLISFAISDLYKLIKYSNIIWAPIITIPLAISIFTKPKKIYFYLSTITSIIILVIWNLLNLEKNIMLSPVIPAMLMSIIVYVYTTKT